MRRELARRVRQIENRVLPDPNRPTVVLQLYPDEVSEDEIVAMDSFTGRFMREPGETYDALLKRAAAHDSWFLVAVYRESESLADNVIPIRRSGASSMHGIETVENPGEKL